MQWEVKVVSPPVVVRHTVDDRDKLGCTALHWAALNDRGELMRWLMSNGADRDARANDGHSPLHWAALKGHLHACKALLASIVRGHYSTWELLAVSLLAVKEFTGRLELRREAVIWKVITIFLCLVAPGSAAKRPGVTVPDRRVGPGRVSSSPGR